MFDAMEHPLLRSVARAGLNPHLNALNLRGEGNPKLNRKPYFLVVFEQINKIMIRSFSCPFFLPSNALRRCIISVHLYFLIISTSKKLNKTIQ